MSPQVVTDRTNFPRFEETLAGIAARTSVHDFAATLGRDELATTMAAPGLASVELPLPTLSIDLEPSATGPRDRSAPDLTVVGRLGEGGMGVVHLAHQRSLERSVAVKSTHRDAPEAADAALCEEASVTGRLEHPNVVPVHALGRTSDGRAAMVMKRIEGVSLRTLLAEPTHALWDTLGTADRLADLLGILMQVAQAVAFAHSRQVVHRDVKPENVMVGAYGEVLLVDFGLAVRLDRRPGDGPARGIVGTPAYMAPEMVAGMPVDARTDVYLLGATLHELIAGVPPHDGETLTDVLARAYESVPPTFDASVPTELAEVCRRAMARDPADRYRDAREFRLALQHFLMHRASYALVRRAAERLATLETRATIAERRESLTEARFACRQALDQWAENEDGMATQRAVLVASVELELRERNAAGARGFLEALASPPPQLVSALGELERTLEAERAGAERLRALEHDLDPRVGADARHYATGGLLVMVAGVAVYILLRPPSEELVPADLLRVAGGMSLVVSVGLAAFFRKLAANALGRKFVLSAWAAVLMLFVHRAIGYVAHHEVAQILVADLVVLTGMLVVTAIAFDARMLAGVPIALAGTIGAALDPTNAAQWFSGTMALVLVGAAFHFRGVAKEASGR